MKNSGFREEKRDEKAAELTGQGSRNYRIGDYARYLGVSPDLLKHYEQIGIIRSQRSQSGYRYYSFVTAVRLFESIRLRNYGMTLHEIAEILNEEKPDDDAVKNRFIGNVRLLEQEASLNNYLVSEYRNFLEWKKPLEKRGSDWVVRNANSFYFLPHTNKYEFLDDPRIYEILKAWISVYPLVKSALRVGADGQKTWGFIVEEDLCRALSLPVNDVVCHYPQRKTFVYSCCGDVLQSALEVPENPDHPAFSRLRALNLECSTDYFRLSVMPADWGRVEDKQYISYLMVIDEE